jgi:hypothetical protein
MRSAAAFVVLLALLSATPRVASQRRLFLEDTSNELITTTACSKILDPVEYVARLDLSYVYTLEFSDSGVTNQSVSVALEQQLLNSVERAIATSVASTLHECNAQQQPVYAVQISSDDASVSNVQRHVIIPVSNGSSFNASCPSVSTSSTQDDDTFNNASSVCRIVRGVTSVLLEESGANQNVSSIDLLVYTLIEATLGNVHFLNQFVVAQPLLKNVQLTYSKYVQPTGGNFFLLPGQTKTSGSTSGTLKVAIVATVLIGLTVTALLLIILCRQHKIHRERSRSDANELTKKNSIVAKKRRRRDPFSFEALEDHCSTNDPDDSLPSGWLILTNNDEPATNLLEAPPQEPTISRVVTTTWSDLTSDSESIMSSLHLDRIDEEVGECSYEQEDNVNANDEPNRDDYNTEQNDFDNVEVSLSNSNWDDEIGSWPSSILPLSLSRQRAIPGTDLFDTMVHQYGEFESRSVTDLNIEVSLDKEIMYSSTITLGSDNTEVRETWKNQGDTSHSFTFSSDSDTDSPSYEAYVETLNDENARTRTPITEHFYNDEDFQSIEMCVVWMDDNNGERDEESFSVENPTVTTFPTPPGPGPDVLFGCQFTNDENDALSGHDSLLQEESFTAASVESNGVSKEVPSSVSQTMNLPESDITDTNDLLKSTLGTESTWSNAYTFSSSGAYRSDLEVYSNASRTGNRPEEPAESDSRAAIAHWAREVMLRLMSGSPKMLRCGTEMEFNSNDSESPY